jgi:hypothetical protein
VELVEVSHEPHISDVYSVPKKNVVAYKLTVRSNFSIVQVLQHCTLNEENKKAFFYSIINSSPAACQLCED